MNYVRNAWYVACWTHDVKPGGLLGMRILDEPIVLWRGRDGVLTAFEDRCVHRLAALSLGRCEGNKLRCMYHGMLYDRGGAVVEIPGQDTIPAHARVRTYKVLERHSWVWVWMGDAGMADAASIPPAIGLDHPDYILGYGQLDYAAEARLINDNLLDLSHVSFVHADSFGASEAWARNPVKVTALDRGVRFERWIEAEFSMPGGRYDKPIDRYSRNEFFIPGILLLTGGTYPNGTAKALQNSGAPDLSRADGGVYFTSQAVTPMTPKTSRYFFSWGPRRDCGDETLRDTLMGIAAKAFAEDRAMIESQQKIIDATPKPKVMPTKADRGATMFNNMVAKQLREEAALAQPS